MAQPSAAGDSPYRGLSIYAPFHAEVILIDIVFNNVVATQSSSTSH